MCFYIHFNTYSFDPKFNSVWAQVSSSIQAGNINLICICRLIEIVQGENYGRPDWLKLYL